MWRPLESSFRHRKNVQFSGVSEGECSLYDREITSRLQNSSSFHARRGEYVFVLF